MSPFECERWATISDRRLLDEHIDEADERFEVEHATVCEACGLERARWAELKRLPAPTVQVPSTRALVESLRAQLHAPHVTKQAKWPRWVAAGMAVAAAASLLVHQTRSRKRTEVVKAPHAEASIIAQASAGAVTALAEGAWLRATDTPLCLYMTPGVRACLSPGAEATLASLSLAARRLVLVRGHVAISLEPQPPGTSFTVSTRDGDVTAVGTLFSVELPKDGGSAEARVFHGAVRLHKAGGTEVLLRAHQRAKLADTLVQGISSEDEHILMAQARLPDLLGKPDDPLVQLAVVPQIATLALDGAIVGRGNAALRLPAGSHVVTIEAPSHASQTHTISLGAGETIRRSYVLTQEVPNLAPLPQAPRTTEVARMPRAATLLNEARTRRSRGEHTTAASLYQRAHAAEPTSALGCAALVALGELQLVELRKPEAALKSFDQYLRSRDQALVIEARLGRIRALRQLGKSQEERQAITLFLQQHPSSVGVAGLRQRLRDIGGP